MALVDEQGAATAPDEAALPFTALAARLPASVPFVGPETQERALGRPFLARLGANESAFGPSQKAIAAMADAASEAWMYGDPENDALVSALSERLGVEKARIAIGEGIDGLLGLIVRLFVGEGTPVVTSKGAYPTFAFHVAGFGGTLHTVPYAGDHEDWQGLADAAHALNAPLVYFANPDNPMGTWHTAADVGRFIDALPPHTVVCLDEAYGEFAPPGTALPLEVVHPRVIRLRTFSKAYGLAGARVGYAVTTPDLASAFNKVRNHFGMSRVSKAGAEAALSDEAHLESVLARTAAAKAEIARIATAHGLTPLPSATNFVTLDTGEDGAFARALVAALAEERVFVRMPFVAPQDRCIRVTAAPEAALAVFENALAPALDAARNAI